MCLRKSVQRPRAHTGITSPREIYFATRPAPEESRRLFGAVWGGRSAASTFSPSVLPAESITRPMCLRKSVQRLRRQPCFPVPRSSFLVSPVPPSGSPQINGQTRSEPAKADNRTNAARTHEWRSRPGGIETQDIASRPVWRYASNSRRERSQNATTELQGRARTEGKAATQCQRGHKPKSKRDNRIARPGANRGQSRDIMPAQT